MKTINSKLLFFALTLTLGAGFIGSIFTAPAIDTWYQTLNKPSFNPPNFIFAPVWTSLYILMGVAFYLILSSKLKVKKLANQIFILQLILNIIWSEIFFGLKNPTLALFEIIILWIAIVFTIRSFYKISQTASFLLVPYILWVSFALFLNLNIFLLNP